MSCSFGIKIIPVVKLLIYRVRQVWEVTETTGENLYSVILNLFYSCYIVILNCFTLRVCLLKKNK